MTRIQLGEVSITRVVEIPRSTNRTWRMLPDSTREAVARHLSWLRPHFWDEAVDDLGSRIQTHVVRTPEHTVLVDTGVGNDKSRAGAPDWHRRQGTYLADLRAAGVAPEDVDYVLCTHLHVDHVGWNTRLVDGRWVPTFPRARYVFHGPEWEFWRWESASGREPWGCIADSVVPVVEAGQALLVDQGWRLGRHLALEPSPGHTPGHVTVVLSTSAGTAVLSGDLMHRTVQVAEPQWSSIFCSDPRLAAETRRAFVERYADSGVLVLAAHFPRPGYIVREDGGHRFLPGPEA